MATMSFSAAIADIAARHGERLAISCGDEAMTFGDLHRHTNRLARAYAQLGVTADSFVTVGLPNSVEFLAACVAIWKLGATPQPISSRLPDRERQAIVELADSSLVLGADPAAHPTRRVLPAGFTPDPEISDADVPDAVATRWKAPTSGGSTGRPKLIVATEPSVVDTDVTPLLQPVEGVVCVPGPLYHNAPFSFACRALFHGNHVVILPKFDAEATLAAVDRFGAQWMLLVPTMMQRITRLPVDVLERYDVSSIQVVWHMASPCPPWLKQEWIDWLGGEKIWELYAGTEAQTVTVVRGDDWLAHRGTVGRPTSGAMRIQDPETLAVLGPGEVGEVFMHPGEGQQTYTYVGATARRTDDGWESLGDMGYMDHDGYLYLADRRSDMIVAGGANIYPAEVEAAIDEHPGVVSSAVIGLPDDDLGSRIHAVVQVSEALDEASLRLFLGERLVRYKVPRSFEFTGEQVRDHAGKVRRTALRDERIAAMGRESNG